MTIFDPLAADIWAETVSSQAHNPKKSEIREWAARVEASIASYNVRTFGAAGDGTTDDTAAWQAYIDACVAANLPIMNFDGKSSLISDTLTIPPYGNGPGPLSAKPPLIDLSGAVFVYDGPRDRPALEIGSTSSTFGSAEIRLPKVVASGAVQWPEGLLDDDTGFKLVRVRYCKITENMVYGFTKGIEYVGCAYNRVSGRHLLNNKFGRVLNTTGSSASASFSNENIFDGGRISCDSSADLLGNAYGQVLTWNRDASYRGQNANRFNSITFELGEPAGATYRAPFLFAGAGTGNKATNCRAEKCKGALVICDGGADNGSSPFYARDNVFGFIYTQTTGQANVLLQLNGANSNTVETERSVVSRWQSGDLVKRLKSDGVGAYIAHPDMVYVSKDSAPSRSAGVGHILANRRCIQLDSNRRLGVVIDTRVIKTFRVQYSTLAGFPGRVYVRALDSDGAPLTGATTAESASGLDWVTAAEDSAGWNVEDYVKAGSSRQTATFDGYMASTDTNGNRDTMFTVRDEVKSAIITVSGGTTYAALQNMQITAYATEEIGASVYPDFDGVSALAFASPLDDTGLTPIASANPATAGVHGHYARGERVGSTSAASAASPGWVCITSGWLAPAWASSTDYDVPHMLVENDSGKVYELVTPGTSAGSGGPTGTSSGITDGTCEWNYVGVLAEFAAEAVLA